MVAEQQKENIYEMIRVPEAMGVRFFTQEIGRAHV